MDYALELNSRFSILKVLLAFQRSGGNRFMAFKMNIGAIDAVLRIGFGAGVIYAGVVNTDWSVNAVSSALLVIIGLTFILTGVIRYCPFYHLIGFSSRKKN